MHSHSHNHSEEILNNHHQSVQGNCLTQYGAFTRAFVGVASQTQWLGPLIDTFASFEPSILGLSPLGLGIGVSVSLLTSLCDALCHYEQDRLNQANVSALLTTYNIPEEPDVLLNWWRYSVLKISLLSDTFTNAGPLLFISEQIAYAAGYEFSKAARLGALLATLLAGGLGSLSEYKTHTNSLKRATALEDQLKKSDATMNNMEEQLLDSPVSKMGFFGNFKNKFYACCSKLQFSSRATLQ